ncbi:hypothetical protein [Brunnivagina elsteri]|uniref:hypothetical protein n=1 Tax=Brunnivagina elsteri TaxID=1247191 RepID=UPI001303F501|nr:hypothetical protein [Calothrix elsteri]
MATRRVAISRSLWKTTVLKVDEVYIGIGKEAGDRAGGIVNKGELYYPLLKK